MATRRRKPMGGQGATVRAFPPMPRVPAPPRFPTDQRQSHTAHILGSLARMAEPQMKIAGPNLVSGFPAASVDLGRLQAALERGLSRFSPGQVEARWGEIFRWLASVLRVWVQRHKRVKIERFESGIRIALTTQDDLGYYDYTFDVFLKHARARGTE